MRKIVIVLSVMLVLSCVGCISQSKDGKWHISLSRNAANTIEAAGEAGTSVLSFLSLFVPGLAGVAGIAGGATTTFKKMKPKLVKNKAVSQHVVTSLETLKKEQPELWNKVKVYMKQNCNAEIEQVIRETINLTKQIEKAV